MGAGVATVGRRPYAVGLYWENSPSGRVSQAAKEAARQPGQQADYFAVRAGNKGGRTPQFGLSPAEAGHKSGMAVFAACLANQQPGSWAGAFRLREGTVVTIVRDDLIVPDGDQFYTDESEARDRLLQEIGFGGLQRIYAPEAWAVPNADTMPISLLMNDHVDIKLRPIRIPKKYILLGTMLAALLLFFIGIAWYMQAQEQEEANERARLDAIERARLAAQKLVPSALQHNAPVYPPPERKWEKKPLPMAVIGACYNALNSMPAAVAGWSLASVSCNGTAMVANWTRQAGFSSPPKLFAINESATAATYTVVLPALEPRKPEKLLDPDEVSRLYLNQNWTGTINKMADDPPPPPPPDYHGEWNPPPAPWVKRSFTVRMPVLPWNTQTFFGDLPGTIVNDLKFNPGGTVGWTIEGVIYENRK